MAVAIELAAFDGSPIPGAGALTGRSGVDIVERVYKAIEQ